MPDSDLGPVDLSEFLRAARRCFLVVKRRRPLRLVGAGWVFLSGDRGSISSGMRRELLIEGKQLAQLRNRENVSMAGEGCRAVAVMKLFRIKRK